MNLYISIILEPTLEMTDISYCVMVKIRVHFDSNMSDEILQDDAPSQSLYLFVYAVALIATLVIGFMYW
ncbi:MAG: hypothetical protein CXX81_08220 [Methanobacteriota archaeon]|nr:MAG: hypothetical protein CXX81_26750 [Euryarchaeota archaeon]PXY75357.1 MAG: hypothetical protein CXX81_18545 [Euryarchaeota archaeon]PXY78327.1 MAG: hypothetical protein CXX81_08220 [Euryarchaeota archaeon]